MKCWDFQKEKMTLIYIQFPNRSAKTKYFHQNLAHYALHFGSVKKLLMNDITVGGASFKHAHNNIVSQPSSLYFHQPCWNPVSRNKN
jgi:hypothetical protein